MTSLLYDRVKALCKIRGTSPTAACLKITGSTGNLKTWQAGKINPSALSALCDLLGCSADYLLGRTDTPAPAYGLSPEQQEELLSLWGQLDPLKRAEFRGELRGHVKGQQE